MAKTFSSKRIWHAANRVMGYDLLIAGTVILIGTIAAAFILRGDPQQASRGSFMISPLSSLPWHAAFGR